MATSRVKNSARVLSSLQVSHFYMLQVLYNNLQEFINKLGTFYQLQIDLYKLQLFLTFKSSFYQL